MKSYPNGSKQFSVRPDSSKRGGELYRQAYISHLNAPLTEEEIATLEKISAERSKRFGIKNLILIVDQKIIQIMEGPKRTVRRMMGRIMESSQYHHGANLFCSETIGQPSLRGPHVMVKRTYNAPDDVQKDLYAYANDFLQCQAPCSLAPATIGFLNSVAAYTFDRDLDGKTSSHYFKTAS